MEENKKEEEKIEKKTDENKDETKAEKEENKKLLITEIIVLSVLSIVIIASGYNFFNPALVLMGSNKELKEINKENEELKQKLGKEKDKKENKDEEKEEKVEKKTYKLGDKIEHEGFEYIFGKDYSFVKTYTRELPHSLGDKESYKETKDKIIKIPVKIKNISNEARKFEFQDDLLNNYDIVIYSPDEKILTKVEDYNFKYLDINGNKECLNKDKFYNISSQLNEVGAFEKGETHDAVIYLNYIKDGQYTIYNDFYNKEGIKIDLDIKYKK